MKRLISLLLLLVLAYCAYPYLSLYLVYRSIQSGDEASLQNQADWPQLRQGFKDDLNGVAAREADRNAQKLGALGGLLTNALAPAIVDGLVETYITPRGVIKLVRSGGDLNQPPKADQQPATNQNGQKVKVTWAFFDAFDKFRVSFEDPKDPGLTGVSLLLGLEGAQWKITRLKLPVENLETAAHKL